MMDVPNFDLPTIFLNDFTSFLRRFLTYDLNNLNNTNLLKKIISIKKFEWSIKYVELHRRGVATVIGRAKFYLAPQLV